MSDQTEKLKAVEDLSNVMKANPKVSLDVPRVAYSRIDCVSCQGRLP